MLTHQVANDAEEMIESPLQRKSWEKAQQIACQAEQTDHHSLKNRENRVSEDLSWKALE